jgi:putative aminopeptidase FrvX
LPAVDGDYMLEQTAALCRIPSPSGFTRAAIDHVAAELERLAIPVRRTVKGALVATRQEATFRAPAGRSRRTSIPSARWSRRSRTTAG